MDRDPQAIQVARSWAQSDTRINVLEGNFSELSTRFGASSLDGVLFDFGVSSPQLDDPERGFSFMRDGPLDMRMDSTQAISAASYLATVDEMELARVLFEYGEERKAKQLARAIVRARSERPLTRTAQLAELCLKTLGRNPDKHPATRTFQALRIKVNEELSSIEAGLSGAEHALKPGGRLAAISFHSLEDRIVKTFLATRAKAPPGDRRLPPASFTPRFKLIDKVMASEQELKRNPRARSAVLRIAERL
jgi:16S rRNA (cytosine1402-N4)-methyltransferase